MARGKSTTTTTTGKTTAQTVTRRATSLEPRAGETLSSLEEAVVRMHHGVSVHTDTQLATNAVTAALRGEMLEMEVRAYTETGRAELLPDVPASARQSPPNARTQKLVDELKKRTPKA